MSGNADWFRRVARFQAVDGRIMVATAPNAAADSDEEARAIIRDLLAYIEELEEGLDSNDRDLCIEGGCGSREWDEESDKFMPRDQRLSYIRDDHVSALDLAKNLLGGAA